MLAGPWVRVEYTRRPRPCRPQLPAEHLQGLGPQTQASQVVSSLLAVLGAGTLEVRVGETCLEQVSRDGAGEKGRRLIRKWQAGLSIAFFSRLDYKPGGAGAMVARVARTHGPSRLSAVRSGGALGGHSLPAHGPWVTVAARRAPLSSRAGGGPITTASLLVSRWF